VGRALPFQFTAEELIKLLPLTVSENVADPAITPVGDSEEIDGIGLLTLMAKVAAFEVPPPGLGVTTVMLAVAAFATSTAGTCALNDVDELKLVGNAVPFQ
jgi:hypothetical protein